ncbi:MAG: hypothetical protein RR533_09590, partial [Carnobacterium sp.]
GIVITLFSFLFFPDLAVVVMKIVGTMILPILLVIFLLGLLLLGIKQMKETNDQINKLEKKFQKRNEKVKEIEKEEEK